MQIGHSCDVGRKRELNEDRVICLGADAELHFRSETAGLFIVADGMGGHSAGEVASELGTKAFEKECQLRLLGPVDESTDNESAITNHPNSILDSALGVANKLVFEEAKEKQALQGMGTTISAALIVGQDLYVAHVGDSRCYIINNGEAVQVTKDHSLVQEMVDAGLITPAEARTHPRKNVITRVVGYSQEVDADSYQRKLYEGDNILLCSDGLWGVLSDEEIRGTVLAAKTAQDACTKLVAQANQLGGPDNISVIVVRPEQLPSRQELLNMKTQARRMAEATESQAQKPHKRLLSFFRRRHAYQD